GRKNHSEPAFRDHPFAARTALSAPARSAPGLSRGPPRRRTAVASRYREGEAASRLPAGAVSCRGTRACGRLVRRDARAAVSRQEATTRGRTQWLLDLEKANLMAVAQ